MQSAKPCERSRTYAAGSPQGFGYQAGLQPDAPNAISPNDFLGNDDFEAALPNDGADTASALVVGCFRASATTSAHAAATWGMCCCVGFWIATLGSTEPTISLGNRDLPAKGKGAFAESFVQSDSLLCSKGHKDRQAFRTHNDQSGRLEPTVRSD